MEPDNNINFVLKIVSGPRFDRETHIYFEWCYRKIKDLNTRWEMGLDLTELERARNTMKEEFDKYYS